jgi:hypothetical protein
MRFLRALAVIGAIMGGYLVASGAPASAAPVSSAPPAAASVPSESYMRYHRGYRRYYAPRRSYRRVYRPYRAYRPRYYRPRVVCRVRYGAYGPRRVCYRR